MHFRSFPHVTGPGSIVKKAAFRNDSPKDVLPAVKLSFEIQVLTQL